MPRTKKAETLDEQIKLANSNVLKTKNAYTEACAALKALVEERDAILQKQLMSAIAKSGKSYEEVLRFLES